MVTRRTPVEKAAAPQIPERLKPQLATFASQVPAAGVWLFEIKFDGWRLLARVSGGRVRLRTRNGLDWTSKLPDLAAAVAALPAGGAWLDGEIVVLGPTGLPDFGGLQNAFRPGRSANVVYYVFDAPFLDGQDHRAQPLSVRRAQLSAVLDAAASDQVRLSATFDGAGHEVLSAACAMGLEGIMAKRADSPYEGERTATWLKLKCRRTAELIVVGFTDREGRPGAVEVGSLILGRPADSGSIRPAGSVGTGWSSKAAAGIKQQLLELEQPEPPLGWPSKAAPRSRRSANVLRWVRPIFVALVSYTELTRDGQVRHASFVELRKRS